MGGLTFDTGMLIAIDRRKQRALKVFGQAYATNARITVPSAVLAEWWRGRTDEREDLLAAVDVEALSEPLARIAGDAMGAIKGATVIDAIVMASAAQRGDAVYTSDFDDLMQLRRYFPMVKVLRV